MIQLTTFIALLVPAVLVSCSDDEAAKGKVQLQVTDAPVDDESVDGVFLSIKGVELRGAAGWEAVATFEEPVSINIMEYTEGNAYFLTEEELTAGTYTEARLMLDAPIDGGAPVENPGCYLHFVDGTTKPLYVPSGAQSGYKVKGEVTLEAGGTVGVTLDFDVRKSVVAAGASDKYLLRPVVRLIATEEAGEIEGTVSTVSTGRVVVYAYEDGTYNAGETEVSGETGVRFSNAISSTGVNANGHFVLGFMPPGAYDLIFVEIDENGEPTEVKGSYSAELEARARLNLIISLDALTDL